MVIQKVVPMVSMDIKMLRMCVRRFLNLGKIVWIISMVIRMVLIIIRLIEMVISRVKVVKIIYNDAPITAQATTGPVTTAQATTAQVDNCPGKTTVYLGSCHLGSCPWDSCRCILFLIVSCTLFVLCVHMYYTLTVTVQLSQDQLGHSPV